jgi:hypothetical protein
MRLIQICTFKSQRDAQQIHSGLHDFYMCGELDKYIVDQLIELGITEDDVIGMNVIPHQINERDRGSLDIWVMVKGWPNLEAHIVPPTKEDDENEI